MAKKKAEKKAAKKKKTTRKKRTKKKTAKKKLATPFLVELRSGSVFRSASLDQAIPRRSSECSVPTLNAVTVA